MNSNKNTLRFLTLYSGILTLAVIAIVVYLFRMDNDTDVISVKRINIVDGKGNNKLVISNQDLMPPPILGGKTFKRAVSPAGLIFYNDQGNEVGGIAISEKGKTGTRAIAFDYSNTDAIGLLAWEDVESQNYRSGLIINDISKTGPGGGENRISLENVNGDARLILKDADGNPRIHLSVDSVGRTKFEVLDKEGSPIKNLLE